MDVTISKQDLHRALTAIRGVVSSRVTMPILGNVKIEAGAQALVLSVTDLDVYAVRRLPAVPSAVGRVAVSARKLGEVVKEAPGETVRLHVLSGGWLEVTSGTATHRLPGLPPEEFPFEPEFGGKVAPVLAGALARLLRGTLYAASTDEARYNMNGVMLEQIGDLVRAVATDGHRLAKVEFPAAELGLEIAKPIILSRKGAAEILRVLDSEPDDLRMGVDAAGVRLETSDGSLCFRLLDATFPEWERVVPAELKAIVTVASADLAGAIRRVSLVSSDRSRGVRLDVAPGAVKLSANNPDVGEAEESVDAEYDGEAIAVGFNCRYIEEAMSALSGDRVALALTDALTQVVVRNPADPAALAVVMPMRL